MLARRAVVLVGLTTLVLAANAGQALSFSWWPFKKKVVEPPQAVQVLGVQASEGAAPTPVLQFWERNTLVLDLQNAGTSGAVVLTAPTNGRWPVRLAFRAAVGQFAVLEVRGEQRAVISLRAVGTSPVNFALDPGVWTQASKQLELSWGAASAAQPTP